MPTYSTIFQLTSSRRGWLCFRLVVYILLYFNSHPHEEDDNLICLFPIYIIISTHILTKRMTGRNNRELRNFSISTHILTKRMTWWSDPRIRRFQFQLTSSRRGWPRLAHYSQHFNKNFNSHPHEEDDSRPDLQRMLSFIFQLTSSRRGWLARGAVPVYSEYFNSHPHEEDDLAEPDVIPESIISTHILTKRMTETFGYVDPIIIFQLTSSRRGWRLREWLREWLHRFQLTSSRRGWQLHGWKAGRQQRFQLTSSRRGWPYPGKKRKLRKHFNSHPHEEDDDGRKGGKEAC